MKQKLYVWFGSWIIPAMGCGYQTFDADWYKELIVIGIVDYWKDTIRFYIFAFGSQEPRSVVWHLFRFQYSNFHLHALKIPIKLSPAKMQNYHFYQTKILKSFGMQQYTHKFDDRFKIYNQFTIEIIYTHQFQLETSKYMRFGTYLMFLPS